MEQPKAIITQIDVNSRGIAADICEKFEELLDRYDITIPDEYREGNEYEARIYGKEWDDLVTEISYIITDLVVKIKENRKAKVAMADYFLTDIEMTRKASKMISFTIKNVIFNDPATIVFWMDGTKTVVKTQDDDIFDPEKGLAMAIAKKVYGNQGNYYNNLKKWLPEKEETETSDLEGIIPNLPKYTNEQWAYIEQRLRDSFKEKK